MRHQVFGKKLNRDIKERKALFKSLVLALISYGKIKTTLAKAKAIQGLTDKLITKAKEDSENAKRQISAFLSSKEATNKLTKEIAPRFKKTVGGYLSIRRVGQRMGDSAEEVVLEWSIAEEKKKEEIPVKLEEKKSIKKQDVKEKKVVTKKKPVKSKSPAKRKK